MGSTLLCTTSDDQLINCEKNELILWKNKFHLNENIEWHWMHLKLNSYLIEVNSNTLIGIWIQFNSTIELKF